MTSLARFRPLNCNCLEGISGKVIAKANNVNSKCLGDAPCTLWFHLTGNTALYPADGRQEFRFHAIVNQPDGKKTMPSTGWQAYLKTAIPRATIGTATTSLREEAGTQTRVIRRLA